MESEFDDGAGRLTVVRGRWTGQARRTWSDAPGLVRSAPENSRV